MYRQQTYRADKVAKTNKEGCKHTKKNNTTFFKKKNMAMQKNHYNLLVVEEKKTKIEKLNYY